MERLSNNREGLHTLNITSNASGAAQAARKGDVIVIVDIIDMSTTAEAALDAGAIEIFGASSDKVSVPVTVNPEKIGYFAGKKAVKYNTELIIVTEPRMGTEAERLNNIQQAMVGVKRSGAKVAKIIPNIGSQVADLANFKDKVVLIITDSGGAAFDAAYTHGAPQVTTGTIVRTGIKKGIKPAKDSAKRAIALAEKYNTGITLVAASSNSYEDILAAEHIAKLIIEEGFLQV
ncbi:hypothetical protein U472_05770 [Orenia metallireducens]|jgi:hypothetical protein|uniref:2-phosphosulfolactate phosphatase n=1 Tax=Orenia metallireducens TaxID=1413210 RepID=A0A1C0A9R4_9FIRM|nr:hypothetical protein [Orenia metallireducens]OCL26993.1 hypothetical protein U472_05770 [Orenia metallireducens]